MHYKYFSLQCLKNYEKCIYMLFVNSDIETVADFEHFFGGE